MTIDMTQFYQVFFEECDELLAEAERLLMALDIETPEPEDLNAIFRAAHSIKGGAATFGMTDMTEITHVLESLLDKIRKNEMALTAEHVDAFLSAKDILQMQVDAHRSNDMSSVDEDAVNSVRSTLQALSLQGDGVAAAKPAEVVAVTKVIEAQAPADPVIPAIEVPEGSKLFHIGLPAIAEKDVTNLEAELGLLGVASLHKDAAGKVTIHLVTQSSADDIIAICSFILDPDDLLITEQSERAATKPSEEKASVSTEEMPAGSKLFVLGLPALSEKDLANLQSELGLIGTASLNKDASGKATLHLITQGSVDDIVAISSFILDTKDLTVTEQSQAQISTTAKAPDVAQAKVEEEEGFGFFVPITPAVDAAVASAVNAETEASTAIIEKAPAAKREAPKAPAANAQESTSIRVGVEKVDQLINLVGELVITQAMIEQRVSKLDPIANEDLVNSIGQLTRNTRDLQEAVMSIRMMPMDYVFSRFPRMVRDLATKLGKKIEFVTEGATTELDKGLIERIIDPLTHLVRNSVDHGIEIPSVRQSTGKNEAGRLALSAMNRGGNIVIEVSDDGAGLNRERILNKAKQSGLPVTDTMPDSDVWQLIFAPGFSTAEVVTDVSGRGVGMDVVKRNVSAMGGVIDIRSAPGFGTTMSISLPLTLAILDGMSVSLGDSLYVIPLNSIIETIQPKAEDIKTVTGAGLMVHMRGEYLPIIPLHTLFNQPTTVTNPTLGVLVIIESEGKKSALFIDGLVGQQQVVIKSLESNYRRVPGISGATIMGDGSVALILDVPSIIKMGQYNNLEGVYQ